ncbi:hypothetical protein FNI16_02570 [Salmonella enterica subsp. diarizonae]|nr:hypothetical protein [Salmonella enterica subsp. enterica serovar Hvittingfoss]ECJ2319263.1 hypothetical protein [Salmonella enterica subsp. diarizonae]ECJ2584244.1 hypothetical protein [Salmonella enterica subsp. diarizonae]EEJ9052170.1 hypothetical protein [Salmonella enterica subsp. diarizonae]
MSTFTVTQSWLLLIGSIILAVFVVRLPLLIKDYRHKQDRKKQLIPPVWFRADEYTSRDGYLFFIGGKTPEQ